MGLERRSDQGPLRRSLPPPLPASEAPMLLPPPPLPQGTVAVCQTPIHAPKPCSCLSPPQTSFCTPTHGVTSVDPPHPSPSFTCLLLPKDGDPHASPAPPPHPV